MSVLPWLCLVGCGLTEGLLEPDVEPVRAPLPPPEVSGPVWTAVVTEAPRAMPARFAADLGPTPSEMRADPSRYPPLGQIADQVCHGTEGARTTLLAAIVAAPAERRFEWGEVLTDCTDPGFCSWVVDQLSRSPPALREALWSGVAQCPGPAAAAQVHRPEAPDDVVALWHWHHGGEVHPRLVEATQSLLEAPAAWSSGLYGLTALGNSDEPEAGDALLRIHEQVHPSFRDAVGHAMWGRDDVTLQLLHRRACQRADHASCGRLRVDPLEQLDVAVREPDRDLDALVADHPGYRASVVEALRSCVYRGDQDSYQADVCLAAWARVDREAAAAEAASVSWPGEVRSTLTKFPSNALLVAHLQEQGLCARADAEGVTALEVLAASGCAFDPLEVGSMEVLLRRLLALAQLPEVAVEVVPPYPMVLPEGRMPRATMHAWLDGVRVRALADSWDGEPDIRSAVAFVNALLARREAPNRLVLSDWPLVVVAGPPAALEKLQDDELVLWALAPTAELADTGL